MPISNNYLASEQKQDETMQNSEEREVNTENSQTFDYGMDNGIVNSAIDFNDPNQIKVTIEDSSTPVVILFGPPNCGKTMTLIRITRWLQDQNMEVKPIRSFRPSSDMNYANMCLNFNSLVNSDTRANSTNTIQFMLLRVLINGNPVCQILEAPGELYFNPNQPTSDYPAFLNTLMAAPVRKIWCFFVEPDWYDNQDRRNYVDKIKNIHKQFRKNDKAVILHNKIDKTCFVMSPGHVNIDAAKKSIKESYPGIFDCFKNEIPISKWFSKSTCEFIPFQTGSFSSTRKGIETFQEGPSEYCEHLWRTLEKIMRG